MTHNALQKDLAGMQDAFLCIIDPSKIGTASLVYSSYLGGSDNEKGHSIAVKAAGGHTTAGGYTHHPTFPPPPTPCATGTAARLYQQWLCGPDPIEFSRRAGLRVDYVLLHLPWR